MLRRVVSHWLAAGALVLSLAATAADSVSAAPAASQAMAVVAVDKLNLRAGPGFAYGVIGLLDRGQTLSVLGRAASSRWIEVRLPEGAGGWVYAHFTRLSVTLSSLPVTEAAGGPATMPARERHSLYMSIEDNQAVVSLQRFPAEQEVVVTLGLPDGTAALQVARGTTDPSGVARFLFPMPGQWADRRPLTQSRLVLTASTVDQSFSQRASIQYYR